MDRAIGENKLGPSRVLGAEAVGGLPIFVMLASGGTGIASLTYADHGLFDRRRGSGPNAVD